MIGHLDPVDQHLLDDFQRDLPLVPRPFAAMADRLDVSEAEVIDRLAAMQAAGRVARVGATVRPNTAGASTLAAMAVPGDRADQVARMVNSETGVNHSYLREDEWNLWFVATAPDQAALQASLDRIRAATGLRVLDLRLVRPFNIDLGFALRGTRRALPPAREPDLSVLRDDDRPLLHVLSQGLPLVPRPFAALDRPEDQVIARIAALSTAGILTRVGVIVRHRAVGWTANAMVVWSLPEDRIAAAGLALAQHPGVTLCYQRRTVPGLWEFPLFTMIHATSRAQALDVLDRAAALPELAGATYRPLFSTRCFRQTGAHLAAPGGKAA